MYHYDDDEKPEDRLKNSAPRIKRNHPLDVIVEKEPKKDNKLIIFIKKQTQKIVNIKNSFKNKRIGKKERKLINTEGHSERALKEYLEYYDGLYQEKTPDLSVFINLVKRNGSPDIPNPYTPDSEDYFKYSIYSLMATDLEVILENILRELKEGEILIRSNEEFYDINENKKILTLMKSLEKNQNDENIKSKKMFEKALQSWAIIMVYGTGCEYLKKQINFNNIITATIETILHVENKEIGLSMDEIVDGAIKFGFIHAGLGKSLLLKRNELINND